jgi:tetratricopeptide (TPR) repeat protein
VKNDSEMNPYSWAQFYKYLPISMREEKKEFENSINNFNENYLYAPGDFKNTKHIFEFISSQLKEENNLSDDFVIFARSFDDKEINSLINKAIKKELCNDPWESDGDSLNSYAWNICTNKTIIPDIVDELERAKKCCMRSIEINECHEILDTYAHVLFALGDYKNAINQLNKAIKLADGIGDDTETYLAFAEEIKNML